jgi:hypothetical protein
MKVLTRSNNHKHLNAFRKTRNIFKRRYSPPLAIPYKPYGPTCIKLDIAKIYDNLESDFVENTLKVMGFPFKIIKLIMSCTTSVSFSILINGQPTENFSLHRGIKQGVPLPLIFL